MAKVIFKSFQEASAFSKNIAMATNSASKIHKDGDKWWVDGPSVQQSNSDVIVNEADEYLPHAEIEKNANSSNNCLISKELHKDKIDNNIIDNSRYGSDGYEITGEVYPIALMGHFGKLILKCRYI